jgi:cell division protein FtsL
MNAAARLVHQSVLSRHLLLTYLLSRRQVALLVLTLAVVLSALGIVYVTNVSRVLHAAYQHNLVEQDRLHVQRSQLLLERGAWMMQARIQQIAEGQLGMIVPDHKSVVIVRE